MVICAADLAPRLTAVLAGIGVGSVCSSVGALVENIDEVAGVSTRWLDAGQTATIRLRHSAAEHGERAASNLGPPLEVTGMQPIKHWRESKHIYTSSAEGGENGNSY